MSGFEGSSLQNPSDHEIKKFEITGREIVLYVPQKFDSTSNLLKEQEAQHHAQLFKILKKMVTQSVKASSPVVEGGRASSRTSSARNEVVEAVPLSYRLPEDCDVQSAKMRLDTFMAEKSSRPPQPLNMKIRNATSLTGEVSVSFELPNDFPANGIDIDKLSLPEEKRTIGTAQNQHLYSFSQRLEGWRVERRQRINGRYDTYYHHVESNTSLRSVVEVVNFLLYEENPYKQKTTQNKSNTPVEGGDHERKRTRSGKTMKKPPAHPNSQSSDSKPKETSSTTPTTNITVSSSRSDHIVREREIHKNILLEQFLADAHNNFLNSHSTNFAPRSSDTRDENDAKEEGVHFDTDSEATEENDMEELLRKAYNNREFPKKKKNVTTQGINKRKRSENSNHEEDRSNIDSDETYSELSTKADEESIDAGVDNTSSGARIHLVESDKRVETTVEEKKIFMTSSSKEAAISRDDHEMVEAIVGTSLEAEPVVRNLDSGKAKEVTTAFSPPRDRIVVANVDETKAQVDENIAVEAKAESAGKVMEPHENSISTDHRGDCLVVLSSFSDQCDLINHIPFADNIFDDVHDHADLGSNNMSK
ncbi:hypothetical protein L484_023645 [Morus notabilis]|uniref:Uncharacterized protein n=1 Tax=Morus notabilis TaxID=981085 RepID=W9RPN3_9ROSA|nr:hypothetical protein L484_023645 [Morus notabilis]